MGDRGSGQQPVAGTTFEVITLPAQDSTATILPPTWRAALSRVVSDPVHGSNETYLTRAEGARRVCLVQGPKGVGKSTFSKALLNSMLSRHTSVAFLESDIGQSEFTPPGIVALHVFNSPQIGPAFTHLHHIPLRAHFVGSSTPRNNPSRYLACLQDLLTTYADLALDNPDLPLIINTQGWVKGLGGDLLESLTAMSQPTTVYNFQDVRAFQEAFGSQHTPNSMMEDSSSAELVQLEPVSTPDYGPPRPNAADLRTLSLLSYLHLRSTSFSSSSTSRAAQWDFATSLVSRRPYAVPFSTFRDVAVLTGDEVAYEEILQALDVSLVALVSGTDGLQEAAEAQQPEHGQRIPYRASVSDDDNVTGPCVGLGVVRSIDGEAGTFHILSPLPSPILCAVNGLQKGEVDLPTVLLTDYAGNTLAGSAAAAAAAAADTLLGVEWKNVPYIESREVAQQGGGIGNARRRIRRNVMRKGQFR